MRASILLSLLILSACGGETQANVAFWNATWTGAARESSGLTFPFVFTIDDVTNVAQAGCGSATGAGEFGECKGTITCTIATPDELQATLAWSTGGCVPVAYWTFAKASDTSASASATYPEGTCAGTMNK